jgi:F0F1-type ATP synthase membrane subunit b/b'
MNGSWPIAAIFILCGLFYLLVVWITTESGKIINDQRNMIHDLISENESLKSRLELHGIKIEEKKDE